MSIEAAILHADLDAFFASVEQRDDPRLLDTIVVGLIDRITHRLRMGRRVRRTVGLRLRFGDFTRATRSQTMPHATEQTYAILETARGLLATAHPLIEVQGLTLVGISLTNLEAENRVQLALPFERPHDAAFDAAVDLVRDRFGATALTRAVLLGRNPGVVMPVLPD